MPSKITPEMLPCPFCGSSDVRLRHHQAAQMSWVSCVSCGLEAPSETGVTDDEAAAYWNRRAALSSVEAEAVAVADSMLRLSVAAVLEADKEFRAHMWAGWEGDTLSDELDGLRRIFEASPPASDSTAAVTGWKLVPIEPTREMWAAMADTLYGYKNRHHDKVVGDLWKAMLSALPASPAAPEGESNG